MQLTIGIDVSKDQLDAHRLSDRQCIQVTNDKAGHKALIRWIGKADQPLIVFEGQGTALTVRITDNLRQRSAPAVFRSPRSTPARREGSRKAHHGAPLVRATLVRGRLAKTDRVDAAMLARMAAVLELERQTAPSEKLCELRELLSNRRALIKDRTAACTRLATASLSQVKRRITARIKQIAAQLAQIDAAMADTIAHDEAMSRKLAILVTIPGIGETTALAMLIEMPELGALDGKQAASLAGLAPISRQSGKWQGRERIRGGWVVPRRAIYMPAIVAARFNPDLKAKYDPLIRGGKPAKLAITACVGKTVHRRGLHRPKMPHPGPFVSFGDRLRSPGLFSDPPQMRKLVVLANALLRDNRKWSETRPGPTRILGSQWVHRRPVLATLNQPARALIILKYYQIKIKYN